MYAVYWIFFCPITIILVRFLQEIRFIIIYTRVNTDWALRTQLCTQCTINSTINLNSIFEWTLLIDILNEFTKRQRRSVHYTYVSAGLRKTQLIKRLKIYTIYLVRWSVFVPARTAGKREIASLKCRVRRHACVIVMSGHDATGVISWPSHNVLHLNRLTLLVMLAIYMHTIGTVLSSNTFKHISATRFLKVFCGFFYVQSQRFHFYFVYIYLILFLCVLH